MRSTRRPGVRRSRGQALAEFALVAPMFFLLLLVTIEAGRFVLYYETLHNATREGARFAIVNGSNSLICPTGPTPVGVADCDPSGERVKERVRSAAFGLLGNGVIVTPTWNPDNSRDSEVRVGATYTYSTLIPLLPIPPFTIEAESTLVINN